MGNQKQYMDDGGFSEYLYESLTERIIINGLSSRVVRKIPSGDKLSAMNLPPFSKTADLYFRQNNNGIVDQARLYVNRKAAVDFDWGHTHKNNGKNGEVFQMGVVHIQCYNSNGKRMSKARLMTEAEIQRYGPIILHYNPSVKFK